MSCHLHPYRYACTAELLCLQAYILLEQLVKVCKVWPVGTDKSYDAFAYGLDHKIYTHFTMCALLVQ